MLSKNESFVIFQKEKCDSLSSFGFISRSWKLFLETKKYYRECFAEKERAFELQLFFSRSKIPTLRMTSKIQFMSMSKKFCESWENSNTKVKEMNMGV